MAIWGRIPVTALPAYIMGQFLGAGAAAGLLVAVWWDVMKVTLIRPVTMHDYVESPWSPHYLTMIISFVMYKAIGLQRSLKQDRRC